MSEIEAMTSEAKEEVTMETSEAKEKVTMETSEADVHEVSLSVEKDDVFSLTDVLEDNGTEVPKKKKIPEIYNEPMDPIPESKLGWMSRFSVFKIY